MKKVVGILLIILIIAQTSLSFAVTQNDLKEAEDNISSTKENIKNIETQKSAAMKEVEKLISQVAAYQMQLDELNTQIADLETEIQQLEKRYTKESELKNDILTFLYKLKEGKLDDAQSLVAENVEVTSAALKYNDGREIIMDLDDHSGILFKEIKWVSEELVCVQIELLKQKKVDTINVYMMIDEQTWKIRNICSPYTIVDN